MITLTLAVGVTTLLVFAANCVYNVWFHSLQHIPGPRLSAASKWPYIFATVSGRLANHLRCLHERYGPVVRVGPHDVSFIDEEACKAIYAQRDGGGHILPKNYDSWQQETSTYFSHSVFLTTPDRHGRMRKALNPAFSDCMMREHESTIMDNVERFISQLAKDVRQNFHGHTSASVNLDDRFYWLAFDTVAEFVFGSSWDCLTSPVSRPWLEKLSASWKFIAIMSCMKTLVNIITALLQPTGLLQSRVDALQPLYSKTAANWDKRPAKPTLLSTALASLHDKTLSDVEVEANAALFTIAGTDTVAVVLPVTVYLLLRHPGAMQRVQSELMGLECSTDITHQRVRQLPFFNACILEAMRIHSPTPEGLARAVPDGGQMISGYWIPGKTTVQWSAYAAYRSALNFDDPDSFLPERWISESSTTRWDDGRVVFRPFSIGPRRCMGQSLAWTEIRLALVKLFWHFDLSLESDEDWLDQRSFLMWEKKPLIARLTPRNRAGEAR